MPRVCSLTSCRTGFNSSPESSFHKFPADEDLRSAWFEKCDRLIPMKFRSNVSKLILCSQHFTEDDYERDLKAELLGYTPRRRLKKDAVPSVNLYDGEFQLYVPSNLEYMNADSIEEDNVVVDVDPVVEVVKIKEEPTDDDDDYIQLDSSALLDDETNGKTFKEASLYHHENNRTGSAISGETSSLHIDTRQIKVENDDVISSLNTDISLDVDDPTYHQSTNASTPEFAVPDSTPRSKRRDVSSLPAMQAWPGNYGFSVTFQTQEQSIKSVLWTYSHMKNKLYVGKDEPCPINFATNGPMPKEQVYVRAMALFSAPEHMTDVVHRCYNHSSEDSRKGLPEAEHLIRCLFSTAKYEVDPVTERHSVVVPFENPPVGQQFSTYLYKFTCFGSCAGGPNRRPLMVIFTLEKGNEVIGRRRVDVKICACPGRDRKTDEQGYPSTPAMKRKETSEFSDLSETFGFLKSVTYPSSKKMKVATNKEGRYTITTRDVETYEFLKQMKLFYEMCRMMKVLPPDIKKKYLELYHKNENTDETH